MKNLVVKFEPLTETAFKPFGTIADLGETGNTNESTFTVYQKMAAPGWLIAKSVVRHRSIDKIAQHPTTKEAFIPLSGVAAILVAAPDTPEELHAFIIERPIILDENVWHATVALSAVAELQIVENAEVTHNVFDLPETLQPVMGSVF